MTDLKETHKRGARMINATRVLAISAHTDDVEFWASGFVMKNIDNFDIRHIVFSTAEESIPDEFEKDSTHNEFIAAQKFMGINNYELYDFRVRWFFLHRQDILEILVKERNTFKPDLILVPSEEDLHQDHSVIGREASRAFFYNTILQYPTSRTLENLSINVICSIPDEIVERKLKLLEIYRSQIGKNRYIERIKGIMEFYGNIYEMKYVEPFHIKKIVMV